MDDLHLKSCSRIALIVGLTLFLLSLERTRYLSAAGLHSQAGSCIRLLVSDFDEEVDITAEVNRLLSGVSARDASNIDVVIDLEDLGVDTSRAVLIARSIFSMLPKKDEWRRVILAAASFPEDLSDVDASTTTNPGTS